MVDRPRYLVRRDEFLSNRQLPSHEFHIGEDDHASITQLPPFRPMSFFVIGKDQRPVPGSDFDPLGLGVIALGVLMADALFKLMRPWPLRAGQTFIPDAAGNYVDEIGDSLSPLTGKTEYVKHAYLSRVCELLDIGLHRPDQLLAIIARIDGLTNARLTERARVILETGIDPGCDDLWQSGPLPAMRSADHG